MREWAWSGIPLSETAREAEWSVPSAARRSLGGTREPRGRGHLHPAARGQVPLRKRGRAGGPR